MSIDNEFFHSHDEDGFWTEVCVILHAPIEDKRKLTETFLARFPPYQRRAGTMEQFCRYAVCHLFVTHHDTVTSGESFVASMIAELRAGRRAS